MRKLQVQMFTDGFISVPKNEMIWMTFNCSDKIKNHDEDEDFWEEDDYYEEYTDEDAFREATDGQCEGENWTSLGRD